MSREIRKSPLQVEGMSKLVVVVVGGDVRYPNNIQWGY